MDKKKFVHPSKASGAIIVCELQNIIIDFISQLMNEIPQWHLVHLQQFGWEIDMDNYV
jgi:hypothetical protein